jgi:RNA polymerase sigma factor (sigma-70 family)
MKRKPTPDQVVSLLERQRTAVLACLMKGLGIPFEEAVDLMYTTLAELVLRLQHCSWPKSVRKWGAYLITMAVHAFLRPPTKDARLLAFYPPVESANDLNPYPVAPGSSAGPAQLAERAELVARVRAALATLDVLRQTAVLLWVGGFSSAEIAQVLSISPTHARVLKCQALKTLRITLKEIA